METFKKAPILTDTGQHVIGYYQDVQVKTTFDRGWLEIAGITVRATCVDSRGRVSLSDTQRLPLTGQDYMVLRSWLLARYSTRLRKAHIAMIACQENSSEDIVYEVLRGGDVW